MDKKLVEALQLAEELLKNIELSELPLASAFLKGARIARLIGDHEAAQIFRYEVGGYPSEPDGIQPRIFELCRKAGRVSVQMEKEREVEKAKAFSVARIEEELAAARLQLSQAGDRDVSVSYSNPNQVQIAPTGNTIERNQLRASIANSADLLSGRRAFLYDWTLETYYDLKFSEVAYDIFANTQRDLAMLMSRFLPSEAKKIASMLDDLASDNSEKWANAAHSCRRLLQEVADAVYPARADVEKVVSGTTKKIKMGKDNFINRLIALTEEHLNSKIGQQIVGSHLAFVGDRLDALFAGSQKGSHANVTKQEGERIFIYTALLATDVLRLASNPRNWAIRLSSLLPPAAHAGLAGGRARRGGCSGARAIDLSIHAGAYLVEGGIALRRQMYAIAAPVGRAVKVRTGFFKALLDLFECTLAHGRSATTMP